MADYCEGYNYPDINLRRKWEVYYRSKGLSAVHRIICLSIDKARRGKQPPSYR